MAAEPESSTSRTGRNFAREVTSKLFVSTSTLLHFSNEVSQGFTQTQQDEDDWNAQGSKSRKKREEKERVVRILSGREAKELYLQCYQLILWKQCYWLITVKGLPKELETVVRDLWNLRIRILQGSEDENGYGSGTPGFSSSGGDDTDTDDTGKNSWASRTSKMSVKNGTKLPKLIETLALCYLGTLLMRLPTSLGEIYNWAVKEELIYVRAVRFSSFPHYHLLESAGDKY